jgi:phosphoribosylformimino-5-aminoimidazole carboxamide ribotide isomerase
MIVRDNSDYAGTMDVILAMDLKGGLVVHGQKGERESYRPLTWGLSDSAEPRKYLETLGPRFLYIADLDRITGEGSHNAAISLCCQMVERCYVDRGIRSPADCLPVVTNVVGTETAGEDLSVYRGGFLSLDIKDGVVIPGGQDPLQILEEAEDLPFDGCLVLNLASVGTGGGLPPVSWLKGLRERYGKTLLFGGGVSGGGDMDTLRDTGFDGAVIATAVHRGKIPARVLREGTWS